MEPVYVAAPEPVFIDARGATLLGRFYRASGAGRHPTVVTFAGLPGSHLDSSVLGYALRSVGWNVLSFQYRGLWGSTGEPFTSAEQVKADIAAVVDFVFGDDSVDPDRVALRGISTGGWIAGSHAAVDERIRTIVLQSPLVRRLPEGKVGPLVEAIRSGSARGKPWVLAMGGAAAVLRVLGEWERTLGQSWLDLAPKLSDRRVLILSGDKDEVIPLSETQALSDAIPKAEWIRHPNADHNWTEHGRWPVTRVVDWLTTPAE